ncbi:MAG: sigma-70 family RNA polymerase sigma factor [Verrucomicrobiales bacterium]|nr:sigma-70 family RNA polymerase sigma factor [Verrucomicrobiales bacterium]
MDALTDDELVARCKTELPYNVTAYRELLRRHEPLVYRSCLKMLGSVQDAEEACQDAFLQVFHKLGQFEGRSAFKTWLYRIVYNRCIESRRKDARRNENHAKLVEEITQEEIAREDPDMKNALTGKVHEVIAKMSGEDCRLVTLRYVSGLSLQEIADVLEIGLSATKMRLYRAQEKFKEIYNDLDTGEEAEEA